MLFCPPFFQGEGEGEEEGGGGGPGHSEEPKGPENANTSEEAKEDQVLNSNNNFISCFREALLTYHTPLQAP